MHIPRLTPAGERVMELATQESSELGQRYLGVEHIFLGVAQVEAQKLGPTFDESRAPLSEFVDILRTRLRRMPANPTHDFVISPRCKRVFEMSRRLRGGEDVAAVGPAEMLSAIVREGRSVPIRLLRAYDVDLPTLEDALEPAPAPAAPADATTPLLDRYGRDLTARAHAGFLSPVIGRAHEMDLIAQVLIRRGKNNPVLIGDAGVGKTAIVEGLAQRLVSDECPEPLQGRRLVEISLGGLVAGTKFRGEFEERVLALLDEVAKHPDVIVFLDEIHTLVGAGAAGGDAMDASNIFKPALARGEVRCIGATTIQEYRRHIEKDPALERRFEKVMVEEPSRDEAREILDRLRPSFEEHHDVAIHADAVDAAIDLTVQHVFDRRLPDKALDAIDQACARRRLERYADDDGAADVTIGAEDVAKTVSQWTGIPLERLSGEAAKDLLNIEEHLLGLVYGQDHAVRLVARTILTAKAGLGEPNRPLGVFLFTGPTGVGKTHLARSLDEVLFGQGHRLVRIDMSEYMEEHSVAKLIGAPPGYVGHENEGLLISALRTHPHCVVLFDEIEKAHPKVFDIFLQIFDEGRLQGSQGRSADFTQAVVILTSNVNVMPPPQEEKVGFNREQPEAPRMFDPREQLKGFMRPELVNRLDAVVPFRPLDALALRRIVDAYVGDLRERLQDRGLDLVLGDPVYDALLQMGNTGEYGARELKRVVDQMLRQPLAQALVRFGDDIGAIHVSVGESGFEFHATTDGNAEEGAEATSES